MTPLPESLAQINRVALNRITRPFAARLPGFAVLHHTGRVSGRHYATPLNAWRRNGDVVVALTYGGEVDWLANARATAPSRLVIQGESHVVGPPRDLPTEDGMRAVPAFVRTLLSTLEVTDFVAFPVSG